MQDTWLDADQTAQSLHITKATLYKLVRKGRVPATKVHGKWRFTREGIEDLFESSEEPASPSVETRIGEMMDAKTDPRPSPTSGDPRR